MAQKNSRGPSLKDKIWNELEYMPDITSFTEFSFSPVFFFLSPFVPMGSSLNVKHLGWEVSFRISVTAWDILKLLHKQKVVKNVSLKSLAVTDASIK